MFDDRVFYECLKAKQLKHQTIAEAMGIDRTTLWRKRYGKLDFTLREIEGCRKYFTDKEIYEVFIRKKPA